MAENLRRLVSGEPLRTLHEQLERWRTEYSTNTCDQNLCQCLEFIEQISKVQGQLFRILTAAAQEGGHYDGVEIIKSRLLPWLEASFTAASLGKPVDSKVPSLQDTFDKEKHKESGVRDQDIQQIDAELNSTRSQLNQVQDELKSLQAQEDSRHRSTEHKSVELRGAEPRASEQRKLDQRSIDKRNPDQRTEVIFDYEKQLRTLKDEIAVLSAEKSVLQGRSARSRTPSPAPHSRSRSQSRSRSTSPSTAVAKIRTPSPNHAKLSSVARKAALLSRFSDAYSQARLDAQCLLRRCIDKAETVQRIIYIATVEAFHVAKMAFRHFKIRVRKSLTPSLAGSNNFEDAVLDYIICHLDLYDSQSSVNDVIRAMNVNPKISFPPEVDFCLLSDFIQEICCIAFAMQTLDPPLDIAFGADGEIFNDCKYRRSYDSDFTAPLVFYHVWPALMENDCVIMKGEAVTKRGAFWNSVRSVSRCRSRSLSPICPRSRIGLSTLSRSRSPSPIRCGLPRF
ncbi:mitochondria-eating protein isoform X2 [Canis lupus baileyi]|uniref:Mitochondria-eating protein n=2 Tax=Canis lupus familiaris TaxID=9615 RepID=A0A8C0SK96_CANLF|nr:mitochondria-eating protein isoform X2 [Canis lupus familiaris]XP_025291500.1 mitochondria-eating protein isoform X2 [Canis lupus dingo]XP_038412002.1 mitochondria-eating protein isoform X2 [Canis lupus familiaris]XP_038541543.1 mitochondria-eating protein isoform X2 [Canis lupus familiaris]|eukprot:XP_005628242.1 mitochondria-eating protein isoform X2 [Canis lupus familiaris]